MLKPFREPCLPRRVTAFVHERGKKMTKKCKVRCRARKGVFDDEMVIRLRIVDSAGKDSEAGCLAYGDDVERTDDVVDQNGETQASLHAFCLDEKEGLASIVLPQPTFQNGPTVIVRKDELMET